MYGATNGGGFGAPYGGVTAAGPGGGFGPPSADSLYVGGNPFGNAPGGTMEPSSMDPPPPPEADPVTDSIAWCLEHDYEVVRTVRHYFAEHAGKRGLTAHRAQDMLLKLETELSVGPIISPQLDVLFARFDFDGNGRIDEGECVKMVTVGLKHAWVARTGTSTEDVKVPEKTIEEAGYVVEKELGRGGQGVAYLASRQMSRTKYCIKVYRKEDANAGGLEELKEEFATMHELQHENIARTYEVFQDYSHYYLVNQPYFGGDLSEIGRRAVGQVHVNERWWRQIFAQCVDGLAYLHGHSIMHCDIKEANIMVAFNDSFKAPRIVLVDFGLSSSFMDEGHGVKGTPGYIPPETWQSGIWYPRGDIFSLGVVMFQMLTGRVPTAHNRVPGLFTYGAKSIDEVARNTQERDAEFDSFPRWEAAASLVGSMLHKHHGERPVALQAINHVWFNSDTDTEFPKENAYNLYGRATEALSRRTILEQLEEKNNLRKLRRLEKKLQGLENENERIPSSAFVKLLSHAGVDENELGEYVNVAQDENRRVPYRQIMQDAIFAKTRYSEKDVLDMFVMADLDRKGYLQREEVEALMHNDYFEVGYEDLEHLMAQMDMDDNGNIDFAEFRRAVLQDGRICRRSDVTARARLKRA
eukprot:CAMPEP_0178402864 /NCGR_PEP_ID=MMETSP0689_2-20121128/17070_1 /TAXON_ID=160604 /ORGANISM="Amphidinium massartii, Strain CS-259" /LENGTH=639 /DNA_ID=CAMNT_0020023795 /DNA_START=65 /DNA_END=1980 /DNA_ORIENTATION=-